MKLRMLLNFVFLENMDSRVAHLVLEWLCLVSLLCSFELLNIKHFDYKYVSICHLGSFWVVLNLLQSLGIIVSQIWLFASYPEIHFIVSYPETVDTLTCWCDQSWSGEEEEEELETWLQIGQWHRPGRRREALTCSLTRNLTEDKDKWSSINKR